MPDRSFPLLRCIVLTFTGLVLCLLPRAAVSDVGRFLDGTQQADMEITMVHGGAAPAVIVRGTVPSGGIFPNITTPLDGIHSILFREPGEEAQSPTGRVGHMVYGDGSTENHLVIVALERSQQGWALRVRDVGEPIGAPTRTVLLAAFNHVVMSPIASTDTRGARSEPETVSQRRRSLARLAPPAPPPGEPAEEGSFVDQITGISAVYGDRSPFREEEKKKDNPFAISGSATGDDIEKLGYLVIFVATGGMMFITFFVGTFVLLFSAKNLGIHDLTIPRAVGTSALLAIIPPGLFMLCMLLPIPVCSVKLTGGLFAFWFSSKIIIAGMLEVMEGKATEVLISFYAVLILLVCVGWIYVQSM